VYSLSTWEYPEKLKMNKIVMQPIELKLTHQQPFGTQTPLIPSVTPSLNDLNSNRMTLKSYDCQPTG
jgi:hypothetical protein